MKISDFLTSLHLEGKIEGDIEGIVENSNDALPNFFFAALSNGDQTGKYIEDAFQKGACGILTSLEIFQKHEHILKNRTVITHLTPRLIFAQSVALFHHHQPSNTVAVTGTNGKSSTVHFFRELARMIDLEAASIGTLGVYANAKIDFPGANLTTPSALSIHMLLEELDAQNFTHIAMEASSHGLDQYRLHAVNLKAAAFTNFTQDHLDYHVSMDEYFQAKMRLFTQILPPGGTAVLNADIPEFETIKKIAQEKNLRILSYGKQADDIKIINCSSQGPHQNVTLEIQGKSYQTTLSLFGEFQLYNALAALGLMMGCEETNIDKLVNFFPKLKGVDGRMQFAGKTALDCDILVDYAHTPDALENILRSLRPQVSQKLWVVFGCGGQRDPVKRSIMGAIASRLADQVIVTDDNPRWEDPISIRAQVIEGTNNAHEIGNRFEAINYAIEHMKKGDLLMIAGKGHETGQIIRDQIIPFNDIDAVKTILKGKQNA